MRKIIYFFIISLFFIGCGDKEENIYDSVNDSDNTTDSSETEDEGGCGPGKDQSEVSDQSELSDQSEMSDDSELSDQSEVSDDSELSDDPEVDDSDGPCPPDMVESGEICIDRYEASRSDASETEQGEKTDKAYSKKGVLPWMVNPMNDTHLAEFKAACEAVGKRLCLDDEWVTSCKGPDETKYSWGGSWDREICNNVDTFCDDYCADNSIPSEECSTSANCGYTYSCYTEVPTGSFENCMNSAGAYDINGNVWEITDTGSGYMTRGGAFNCAGAVDRLACTFNAGWTALFAGFRCCKDKN